MFDSYYFTALRAISFDLIQCVQANPSSFEVLWIGCYVSMVSNILLVVAKYFAC